MTINDDLEFVVPLASEDWLKLSSSVGIME